MSQYIRYPFTGGIPEYPTASDFPSGLNRGSLAEAVDSLDIYAYTGSVWVAIAGPGSILGIGTIDSVSPSPNGAVISGTSLIMQSASATVPGLVNTTTQTFAGNKTWNGTNTFLSDIGGTKWTIFSASGRVVFDNSAISSDGSGKLTVANLLDNGLSVSQLVATDGSKNLVSQATGNLTDAGTDGIVVTGGTGAVVGTGTSLAQHVADTTHNGYLSSTDWNTFNSKQPAGSYITALTGDVTATGPGSAAATVAKIQGTVVSGTTGTTNVVFSNSPTLVTPNIGAASGTTLSLSGQLTSTVITGTAPFVIASTTQVANLNVASAGTATNATNVATTATNSTNASFFPTFVASSTSSNQGIDTATGLSFNPSTNTLTTTTFSGNATTATTATNATNVATTATNSTNASFFPTFVASSTSSNQSIDTATGLSFNPSTNTLTTTTFSGNATTSTTATNVATTQVSNNASYFPLMVASSTNSNQAADLGTGLTFNPSTNSLSTTTFVGALTGTASGNTTITPANHAVVISSSTNTLSTAATSATSGVALVSQGSSTDPAFGTVVIAGGGTGQTTKAAAFDALSPMTTLGDTIYGGASGTGTRLAGFTVAANAFHMQTGTGSGSAAPVWQRMVMVRYKTAAGQSIASGSDVKINFGTSVIDTASNVTNPSTDWLFTASVAGIYRVSGALLYANAVFALADSIDMSVYYNGAKYATFMRTPVQTINTEFMPAGGTTLINMAATDTVYFTTFNNSTGSKNLFNDNTYVYCDISLEG